MEQTDFLSPLGRREPTPVGQKTRLPSGKKCSLHVLLANKRGRVVHRSLAPEQTYSTIEHTRTVYEEALPDGATKAIISG